MSEPTIDDLLAGWEISRIEIITLYSGDVGARGVIVVWECTLANRRVFSGRGETIMEAVRNAVQAMEAGHERGK